jgi:radical SAM superfamily enzyme YgiQ (UPF0313 family)
MRVLLVAATPLRSDGSLLKQRRLWLPSLGLPLIAALTPADVEVELVNETIQEVDFDAPVDLVGISGMGVALVRAWQIADEFRRRGRKVVLGGVMASLAPEASLDHCDALVIGEAEGRWPQVVRDAEKGRLRRIYRSEVLCDLQDQPVPRFDMMPRKKLGFWLPIEAGRGCVYDCDFCSVARFHRGVYRKRPLDQIARDVEAVIARGTRKILLLDDNIGSDPRFAADLFRMLTPYRIQWMTQCSLSIARQPEVLKLAADSGCVCMSFGLETIRQSNLGSLNKDFLKVAGHEEAIRRIRSFGIDVSTEMMVGLEDDDQQVIDDTVEFLIRNRITVPRLWILTPVPGTRLYERWESEGRIFDHEFSHYTGGQVVYHPGRMNAEELQQAFWQAYERLFRVSSIFRRFFLKRRIRGLLVPLFFFFANFQYRRHVRQRVCPGIV